MPSSPKDNTMLSAQESYFKSHFQATVDKLNPALETEEVCSIYKFTLVGL